MNKLLSLIPNDEKINLFIFFILSFFVMVFETLSIAIIFPLIILILNKDLSSVKYYDLFEKYLIDLTFQELLFFVLVAICTLYLFKNLFLIFCHWFNLNFINRVNIKIQKKIFNIYISQPLLENMKKNIGVKFRNTTNEISILTKYMIAIMQITIETTVLIGIFILFLIIQPIITFIIFGVISIFILIFYYIAKIKAYGWSKTRLFHSGRAFKTILEGLNSIKEIKIFGKSNFFLELFSYHQQKTLNLIRNINMLNYFPRVVIETVTISAVCFSIIYMVNMNYDTSNIIAVLGIFSAAAFRVFPSITRIIGNFNTIKAGLPSVDLINDEISNNKILNNINDNYEVKQFDNSIVFKNVTFKYPAGNKNILNNVSFKISKGSRVGISGDSGSGKSTLLTLMLGLIQPDNGDVLFDNIKTYENFEKIKKNFGYVSQDVFLLDETIKYNVTLGLKEEDIDYQRLKEVFDISNLSSFVNSLADKEETQIGEKALKISGGQRQRLVLARALYNKPEIIILDEATSELDKKNELEIFENILNKNKNKTMIIITHNKDLLNICNQIISINGDKVVSTPN